MLRRSSQDFTHCCTLRSKARESPTTGPSTAKPSCSSKSAFADALAPVGPCLGVLSRGMHTASLQSIMSALNPCRSRSVAIHATCSGFHAGLRLQDPAASDLNLTYVQAAHPALRALFPELVLARKVRRPGESEELQTSSVLALAETSDCIHHRLVECATQAVQQYSFIQRSSFRKLRLCQTCAYRLVYYASHCRGAKSSTTTLTA